MENVTVAHARDHLDELLERAARGEDVRITDPKLGTIKLMPFAEVARPAGKRKLGHLEGKIPPPPDDFFDPMSEEELKLWYGDDA